MKEKQHYSKVPATYPFFCRIAGALARFLKVQDKFTSRDFIQYATKLGLPSPLVSHYSSQLLRGFAGVGLLKRDAKAKSGIVWRVV
jgi:hypothetical protein